MEPGLGRATPKQMKVHVAFLGFPEWNRHGFIKVKYMQCFAEVQIVASLTQ